MFEFFKDTILQIQGIDTNIIRAEKLKKEIAKKESKIFLATSTKNVIRVTALLYFAIAIFSIISAVMICDDFRIIKISFLFLLTITVFILTFIKNKTAEILSLVGILLFMIVNGFINQ